ncbi:MAG: hypothetical protein MR703_03235 [Prevotella sp.]|nr:hypothetical protein [Prevotella sp.]
MQLVEKETSWRVDKEISQHHNTTPSHHHNISPSHHLNTSPPQHNTITTWTNFFFLMPTHSSIVPTTHS